MIDRQVDSWKSGKGLALVLGLAAVLCVMWLVSNVIVADARRGVILLSLGLAVVVVATKTLNDWHTGVYLFLAWLLFEDLARKYMGNSMYVYFGKDVLIGITYASLVLARLRGERMEPFRVPFKFALALFILLGVAQVFNPDSFSLWYGLLGLKLYFYYIPLMFVGYALLRTERDLHRFMVVSMGLAAVIALVGIIQAIVGLDFLNPHSGEDIEPLGHLMRTTPSGLTVVRPPSVFVSDGRFAAFVIVVFILGLGAAAYMLQRRKRGRVVVFVSLGLVAVAATLTGSRGAFSYVIATALLLSLGMLWGAPPKAVETYRLFKAIRRSFIFVAIALSLAVTLFPDVVGVHWAYYAETLSPYSPDYEASVRVWDYPANELLKAFEDPDWVTGHGIGTSSLGVQYVARIMQVPRSGHMVENGYGTLMLELGILGPILWLAWSLSLVWAALKVVLKLKGTWAFPVALSVLWFAFILLFPLTWGGLELYQNFVVNAYFWLLVGVLFRLPVLARQDSAEMQATYGPLS